ncbi:MAG: patatin-like phospholipase family protein [Gammaproteobacteria bacterium]|nr:patatin-like phospholipase family protein [Gammaproteobacteria bacterium]
MTTPLKKKQKIGLILSGGGARAAYQVGVLKAIAELAPHQSSNPFDIICGTSAGAINGVVLASRAASFRPAIRSLEAVWQNFTTDQVYETGLRSILHCAYEWLGPMVLGRLVKVHDSVSLFDNSPLRRLLRRVVPFENIDLAIEKGYLHAISISASSYTSGHSTSFFQATPGTVQPWERARRIGVPAKLSLDHLMASSAIPIFFPAVKIGDEYFGDGAVRQLAPISPALHLGADKVLVIGVSGDGQQSSTAPKRATYPTFAQIAGHMLNSAFIDSLEGDIERLERVNQTIDKIPAHLISESETHLRKVDVLVISPSEALDKIAARHVKELPKTVRFFLGRAGANRTSGASIISYLLFERGFTSDLISLGYADAMRQKEKLIPFMEFPSETMVASPSSSNVESIDRAKKRDLAL